MTTVQEYTFIIYSVLSSATILWLFFHYVHYKYNYKIIYKEYCEQLRLLKIEHELRLKTHVEYIKLKQLLKDKPDEKHYGC